MPRPSSNIGQGIATTVSVGKNGITDSIIEEIKKQIRTRKIVKVRLHGESKLGRHEAARELAAKSGTRVVDVRGFTVMLSKKRSII